VRSVIWCLSWTISFALLVASALASFIAFSNLLAVPS
jgi:hypothetical protein